MDSAQVERFGIGDVVRTDKADGPTMLVVDFDPSGAIVCAWPDGEQIYAASCLRLVTRGK